MRVLGVIPARLGSTRLPDKPLQLLAGEPLITRVIERVLEHRLVDRLVLATDSSRVADAVKTPGVEVVLTDPAHSSGTDRVAEVAGRQDFGEFDVVVNIQGDEPFLSREALAGSVGRVRGGDDVGTAAAPLAPGLVSDPSRVKVVFDARGRALYFSRAVIPHRRDRGQETEKSYWQHVGIYAYTRQAITRWPTMPPSPAEQAEQLEQLRALHHGLSIGVAQLEAAALPGIDTPEDLRRAEAHWHAYQGQV
jgi:3-deoxy-manno-octulosonate cytidylyltransferase (CMP-KDO synthetase)